MNIGIIGNINNYPFLLGEGLRACGARPRLVVTRSENLHHPVKAGLVDELPEWVYDASPLGQEAFENQDGSIGDAVNFALNDADFVILNDVGPSLYNLVSVPILSMLTGSDLTYYANIDSGMIRRESWGADFMRSPAGMFHADRWEQLVFRQRTGIRRSRVVSYPDRGLLSVGDSMLDQIGVVEDQRMFLYFTDTNRVERAPMPRGKTLKILNGARLNWVDPMPPGFSDQDHKGTDRLLHGLRLYLDGGGDAQLTLVAKGLHVAETRALVDELGLEPHVVWRDEMTVAEFTALMAEHHVVCDQFGRSCLGMVGLTAMARGRPVLARFPDAFERVLGEPWPVCHAETPEAISDRLSALSKPKFRAGLGDKARQFAERFLSPAAAGAACIERLYGARLWTRELNERRLRAETETQRHEIEERRGKIDAQQREIEDRQREIEAQRQEIEAQRQEIEDRQREIEDRQREIEAQRQEIAARNAEADRLAGYLENTIRQVDGLSSEREYLLGQAGDLQADLDVASDDVAPARTGRFKP